MTTVRPSCFGFAVAVHPTDPDTAWFVPAVMDEHRIPVDGKVVVARTRDGVRSFEVDLEAGELRKSGLKFRLQEQPFQVLAMLLERPFTHFVLAGNEVGVRW